MIAFDHLKQNHHKAVESKSDILLSLSGFLAGHGVSLQRRILGLESLLLARCALIGPSSPDAPLAWRYVRKVLA